MESTIEFSEAKIMFYKFHGYYITNQSELDWYEKAQNAFINHGYWDDDQEPLMIATLNIIFMEFAYLICDESVDVDLKTCLHDEGFDTTDWVRLARKYDVKVTLEMIEEYMREEDLQDLSFVDFEKMFGEDSIIFHEYLKEELTDYLYDEHSKVKRDFLKAIKEDVGNNSMDILFFFYVRENKYKEAWEMYDSDEDLWSLHQPTETGLFSDREHVYDEDDEEVTGEETILYSFANGDALEQWRVLRVMSWIENGLEF
jgi:hypothetical protein